MGKKLALLFFIFVTCGFSLNAQRLEMEFTSDSILINQYKLNIKITNGTPPYQLKVFEYINANTMGKTLVDTSFTDNNATIPGLGKGIYVVYLESKEKKIVRSVDIPVISNP